MKKTKTVDPVNTIELARKLSNVFKISEEVKKEAWFKGCFESNIEKINSIILGNTFEKLCSGVLVWDRHSKGGQPDRMKEEIERAFLPGFEVGLSAHESGDHAFIAVTCLNGKSLKQFREEKKIRQEAATKEADRIVAEKESKNKKLRWWPW